MVTRISSFGQNDIILNQMLRNQQRVFEDQRQVVTGRKASSFDGFAGQNSAIISAKTMLAQAQAFMQTNTELQARLEFQNTTLGAIADLGDRLHQELIKAVGRNSGLGLNEVVEDMFQELVSLLNTRFDGKYIFGGTKTDTAPVNVNSVTDLINLATAGDAFDNNAVKSTLKVEENRTLTFGVLADEVALPLLTALRRLLQFENGILPAGAGSFAPAGSFSDPLSENQRQFLVSEFSTIIAAIDAAREAEAINGINLGFLDQLTMRQRDDVTFLKGFVGELEDVDMAEAISNLQRDQIALEVSLHVTARLTEITLLNFI